jgi:hypothetical protein
LKKELKGMKGESGMLGLENNDIRTQSLRQIAYGNTEGDLKKCDEYFIYELLESVSNLKWMLNPNRNLFLEHLN